MKAILLAAVLLATIGADALAEPRVAAVVDLNSARLREIQREEAAAADALQIATAAKIYARAKWDAAVAGGHPVPAGKWAQRHFDAMQAERAALMRWQIAARQLAASR
jgi:hypothetical protein